jgi:hypothetical protein
VDLCLSSEARSKDYNLPLVVRYIIYYRTLAPHVHLELNRIVKATPPPEIRAATTPTSFSDGLNTAEHVHILPVQTEGAHVCGFQLEAEGLPIFSITNPNVYVYAEGTYIEHTVHSPARGVRLL